MERDRPFAMPGSRRRGSSSTSRVRLTLLGRKRLGIGEKLIVELQGGLALRCMRDTAFGHDALNARNPRVSSRKGDWGSGPHSAIMRRHRL